MTENDKLDLILTEINGIKAEIGGMKAEIGGMKTEIGGMKTEIGGMKTEIGGIKAEIGGIKEDIQQVKQRTAEIGMHIENHTDKNTLLIAENFIELTNKLNQAIPAADKNLAYQVKVDYVFEKVKVLEKDMAELKSRTA